MSIELMFSGGGRDMRDTRDTMTAEIPGLEPPPAKPVRVTIAEKRQACAYAGPLDRDDTCRHCRHRSDALHNTGSWDESQSHRCKLHDFPVQLGGVCNDHERAVRC